MLTTTESFNYDLQKHCSFYPIFFNLNFENNYSIKVNLVKPITNAYFFSLNTNNSVPLQILGVSTNHMEYRNNELITSNIYCNNTSNTNYFSCNQCIYTLDISVLDIPLCDNRPINGVLRFFYSDIRALDLNPLSVDDPIFFELNAANNYTFEKVFVKPLHNVQFFQILSNVKTLYNVLGISTEIYKFDQSSGEILQTSLVYGSSEHDNFFTNLLDTIYNIKITNVKNNNNLTSSGVILFYNSTPILLR